MELGSLPGGGTISFLSMKPLVRHIYDKMKKIRDIKLYNNIIKLKQQGNTIPKICEILDIKKGTVGYYLKIAQNNNIDYIRNKPTGPKFNKEKLEQFKKKKEKTHNDKILNEDWENLSYERKRKRVKLEQNNKCNRCSLDMWLGKQLILELEHKDGNNKNNNRNNLEALCPNCHSLTNTWKGKNKTHKRNKISDELFIKTLIKNELNIRQTLLELKLTPKGGNYKRAYRLINYIN